MNIVIYYLSKKITIEERKQASQNQLFKNLDGLSQAELLSSFELFINQKELNDLYFETESLEFGLEKFKKTFKLIYAAGGLIESNDRYLFIYRLKKWDLPKGKIDMGESPEEAAIRECEEECSITQLTITKVLEPTYHMYEYKGSYALKKTYWYEMVTQHQGNLVPQIEENIERVEWFSKEDIKQNVISDTYPAILDVLKNGISF
jgi:8-oxo-dGTP pyrophosphatase MutT (NUDIX family)